MSSLAKEALPMSARQIRRITTTLRALWGINDNDWVDVERILEFDMPRMIPDFVYDVRDRSYMGDQHGFANPSENYICIRDDIYNGMISRNGRDRLTVMHEIGHIFLHHPSRIVFGRNANVVAYKDPEWQANCFAGEFLANVKVAQNCPSLFEFANTVGISIPAAKVQLNRYYNEGVLLK